MVNVMRMCVWRMVWMHTYQSRKSSIKKEGFWIENIYTNCIKYPFIRFAYIEIWNPWLSSKALNEGPTRTWTLLTVNKFRVSNPFCVHKPTIATKWFIDAIFPFFQFLSWFFGRWLNLKSLPNTQEIARIVPKDCFVKDKINGQQIWMNNTLQENNWRANVRVRKNLSEKIHLLPSMLTVYLFRFDWAELLFAVYCYFYDYHFNMATMEFVEIEKNFEGNAHKCNP